MQKLEPCSQLVGMNDAATMVFPQKIKNRITIWPDNSTSACMSPKPWNQSLKEIICTPIVQMVKRLRTMWETQVQSLGWKDPLEKEMATQSSILAWKIPWTEEPGRLQSMGSQRVRHNWATELNWTELILAWRNPMDRVWQAIVHGVAKNLTRLCN